MNTPFSTAAVVAVALSGFVGCAPANTPQKIPASKPADPPVSTPPTEFSKDTTETPIPTDARPAAEAVLKDLLSGYYDNDPDYGPIARKLDGFKSWSIESEENDPEMKAAINVKGFLTGKSEEATFTLGMVKQQDGRWMIGTFDGPHPKSDKHE